MRDVYIINDSGIEISLNETSYTDIIETSLDHNDSYQVDYLLNASMIDSQDDSYCTFTRPLEDCRSDGFIHRTSVQQKGFNAIRILPLTGEDEYCIGAVSVIN